MSDGTPSPEAPPVVEKSGIELLNELNRIAPLSDKSAEALTEEGWKEFYSYREYENNGATNKTDLQLALAAIQREAPTSLGDWNVVRAKMDQFKGNSFEHERLRALLKKETEKRLEWEKSQGYR